MNSILKNLRSFNRKERFYLVGMALGNHDFRLHPDFRKTLKTIFKLDVPADAFVAMDYHLDWIYASLFLASTEEKEPPYDRNKDLLKGNQEDVDLLIAWGDKKTTHLIFLEAKGVTSFLRKQLNSKVRRLSSQFNEDFKDHVVKPHFALVSPKKPDPQDIITKEWPEWMRKKHDFYWIPLTSLKKVLHKPGLRYVVRCEQDGTESKSGHYWKVVNESPRDDGVAA